jgi:diguanylate cyclase (GGDEF)-like protein
MKKLFIVFALISQCAFGAWAQPSGQITTLHAVTALTNDEAAKHPRVAFEATVTYYHSHGNDLFVQDGDDAIFVLAPKALKLAFGDRIRVHGTMQESFRPFVVGNDIAVVGHGPSPKPLQPSFEQMISGELDCRLVTMHGMIRSADLEPDDPSSTSYFTFLRMFVDGGPVEATIDNEDESALKGLLDAEVEITGAVSGRFDNKMQMTGIVLHVQSIAGVKILKHAGSDPWSLPVTPMDLIISGYRTSDSSQRMRVRGTVTYYQFGTALVLQDGAKSLWINTDSRNFLQLGDVVDAIGFPAVENGFLTLNRGEIHETSKQAPVTPSLFTWHQLAIGGNDGVSQGFDLVSVEGRVVTEVRQPTQDEYVLDSDGHQLSAIIRHPGNTSPVPLEPMREIPVGARIRVTGICMLAESNPFDGEIPFNILMRNADDILVVARPSLLNVRNLILLVGLLLAVVIAIGARSWAMERHARQEAAAVAYIEQRRSRILEDINNSRPLSEIIASITQVTSFRLHGAACWCKTANGTSIGLRPPAITTQRIIQQDIPGRSGAVLGTIFAAINRHNKPREEESMALDLGAGLASLAIETSRLYFDLVRRSEFDLLTDVPNRFSMEKHLDAMIEGARQSTGIVGFIFIDLDDFKQVNDQYGHQVGDLFLQEAARRMQRQLRPGDTLARLGGDEFAAVISTARRRHDVLEIALRLERCFDEPIAVGGRVLRGSASVGFAIYPEDAASAHSLLTAADAAMYAVKQTRKSPDPISAAAAPVLDSKIWA